jgi:hypothetical protein
MSLAEGINVRLPAVDCWMYVGDGCMIWDSRFSPSWFIESCIHWVFTFSLMKTLPHLFYISYCRKYTSARAWDWVSTSINWCCHNRGRIGPAHYCMHAACSYAKKCRRSTSHYSTTQFQIACMTIWVCTSRLMTHEWTCWVALHFLIISIAWSWKWIQLIYNTCQSECRWLHLWVWEWPTSHPSPSGGCSILIWRTGQGRSELAALVSVTTLLDWYISFIHLLTCIMYVAACRYSRMPLLTHHSIVSWFNRDSIVNSLSLTHSLVTVAAVRAMLACNWSHTNNSATNLSNAQLQLLLLERHLFEQSWASWLLSR